jgi:hypothetical protein
MAASACNLAIAQRPFEDTAAEGGDNVTQLQGECSY